MSNEVFVAVRHRFDLCFSLLVQLSGIVVGHLYYFLVFKYPQDFGGAYLLQTPSFL